MLRLIKRNYFLLISVFLIFYFGFNLVSGERGLFSYIEKKALLSNLKKEELSLNSKIEEKDHIRNWQPPINGEEIMKLFNIEAGKEVGVLKNSLKDAILDGKVKNEKEAAIEFMKLKAKEINLKSDD